MSTLTPVTKPDGLTYYSIEALRHLSLAEVEALWEGVPTERQRQYRAIYERFIHSEGVVGSDAMELKAVNQIIDQYYVQEHMVPVLPNGEIWVRVPKQVRDAAAANAEVVRPALEVDVPQTKKRPMVTLFMLGLSLLVFGFIFINTSRNKGQAVLKGTAIQKPTITAIFSPTPTPLAFDAQDSIIQGGDTSSRSSTVFPVNLRVIQDTEKQPRVFIVQRKIIQTTEWNYAENPDTVSYLSGLIIRPVVGIPWSPENATLFEKMTNGTTFVLQMNTGTSQRFAFESRNVVNRSDTSLFQQSGPGLVLTLIGEHDPDTNEPTSNRMVVIAKYLADLELSGNGSVAGLDLPKMDMPTPTLTSTPVIPNVGVEVISVETRQNVAVFRLRIFNTHYTTLRLDDQAVQVIYGYQNYPVGPKMAAEIPATDVLPGQAVDLTVNIAWHSEPYATLIVFSQYQYTVTFSK
ncbi:MAG: hypothetical protein ABI947_19405 [Chloroflexota bacterium]